MSWLILNTELSDIFVVLRTRNNVEFGGEGRHAPETYYSWEGLVRVTFTSSASAPTFAPAGITDIIAIIVCTYASTSTYNTHTPNGVQSPAARACRLSRRSGQKGVIIRSNRHCLDVRTRPCAYICMRQFAVGARAENPRRPTSTSIERTVHRTCTYVELEHMRTRSAQIAEGVPNRFRRRRAARDRRGGVDAVVAAAVSTECIYTVSQHHTNVRALMLVLMTTTLAWRGVLAICANSPRVDGSATVRTRNGAGEGVKRACSTQSDTWSNDTIIGDGRTTASVTSARYCRCLRWFRRCLRILYIRSVVFDDASNKCICIFY